MSEEHRQDPRFWFGFFLGGLLGAIVLFFVGTKEGQKTGKKIRETGEDFVDDLQGRLEDLKQKGRELAEESETLKEELAVKIGQEKEKLTEDVTKKLDDVLTHIEAIQERGRRTTASIRKGLFKNTPPKKS